MRVPVGSVCEVRMRAASAPVLAEVVGFSGDRAYLMPTGDVHGLASGARVVPRPAPVVPHRSSARATTRGGAATTATLHLPVGDGLLGRVVDAHGQPMDRKGPLQHVARRADDAPADQRDGPRPDPRSRSTPACARSTRMLTVGRGQRIGLFAGTGVGKSVLLGMMARYTAADVIVVGLIGERGREVKEFIEDILGEEGLRRSVVVAAPADAPPLVRMQGANYATAIAEHFRDQGKHVLLLMDSLTRYAMAQREIALAIGEPPATKGYPPSVLRQAAAAGRAQPATASTAAARSPRSTPCCPKATTSRTRSPTRRAASSTATSCSRASWPRPATTRRSTSSARSRA